MSGTRRFKRADAVDWRGVERSPEFQQLVRARRRFLIPLAVVFAAIVLAYLLLASFAHEFMGRQVGGLPVAYVAALTQVALAWIVTFIYLRKADSTFTPLERRVAEAVRRPDREAQR